MTRAALRSRRENKLAVDRYGERGPKQISSDKTISRHLSANVGQKVMDLFARTAATRYIHPCVLNVPVGRLTRLFWEIRPYTLDHSHRLREAVLAGFSQVTRMFQADFLQHQPQLPHKLRTSSPSRLVKQLIQEVGFFCQAITTKASNQVIEWRI